MSMDPRRLFACAGPWMTRAALSCAILAAAGVATWAMVTDLTVVDEVHDGRIEHVSQASLRSFVIDGDEEEALSWAFRGGNLLFETKFNALDGIGANVGAGQRFTRIPRADLAGPGEWANHVPPRATGPNAESCNGCHSQEGDDGSGPAFGNVHRDPLHTGTVASFIQRNTPHLFGIGALQRLAEEMTQEFDGIVASARAQACSTGSPVTLPLLSKGVSFGAITATPSGSGPCTATLDTSAVVGIDPDLVVRPFQWKGSVATIREFARSAAHNELGMQAVELVGIGVDGDSDGVANELSVGDVTSYAVYLAAQPRPVTKSELAALGLIPALSTSETASITRGKRRFHDATCDSCHVPNMRVDDPRFSEPSLNSKYRDAVFPAGQNPRSMQLDPVFPVTVNITRDIPDNRILDGSGNLIAALGNFPADAQGRAVIRLFGDLKRHDMGPGLAESIDEVGTGASTFMTENLWGVGSTAPYLHDGRASTITEAILEHGGEAAASRALFLTMPTQAKKDVVAFLQSLVLFKREGTGADPD